MEGVQELQKIHIRYGLLNRWMRSDSMRRTGINTLSSKTILTFRSYKDNSTRLVNLWAMTLPTSPLPAHLMVTAAQSAALCTIAPMNHK